MSPAFNLLQTRRRFIAATLAGLMFSIRHGSAEGLLKRPRVAMRRALAKVKRWGCQYQNMRPREISASDLDLVVIDPSLDDWSRRFVTPAELQRMKRKPDGSRRIVLAYLCVGETDTKRWYWPERWRQQPPPWVGLPNPAWPGSRYVRFWDPEWQDLVFRSSDSILDRILDIGFDGALLDRVDAYLDWADERPTVEEEMVDLVADLAVKARARAPGFILLPQNAELLLTRQRYLSLIDAHNKESLLSGLGGEGVPNTVADIQWSLGYLDKARKAGILMLATEYLGDPEAVNAARTRLAAMGFLPFMGVRQLDRLPDVEG